MTETIHDALGIHEPPNVAAASRRGLFGPDEHDVPREELERRYEDKQKEIEQLGKLIAASTVPNDPSGVAAGNTDGSGNLVLGIYQVATGTEYRTSRIVVEVDGSTPSSPFTGVGYCAIYALDSPQGLTVTTATVLGGLRDVAAGSATQAFLPAIFEYGDHQSPRIRGPKWLAVVISAGPASKRVTVYYQGALRRLQGIA